MRTVVPWLVVAAAILALIATAWWADSTRTQGGAPAPASQTAPEAPR